MFIERRVNESTGRVELWRCRWVNQPGKKPHKEFIEKIGDEQPISTSPSRSAATVAAICWSWGRTLGSIAVESESVIGQFSGDAGDDAVLPCSFVNAGKFRHGPDRWWCQTHQCYWGTKGDLASLSNTNVMRCSNHAQRMSYVLRPLTVDLTQFAEVGLWCSLPAAISTLEVKPRAPRLHLHLRKEPGADKLIDRDIAAVSITYNPSFDLFGNKNITQVNVTPPAAFEFVRGIESGRTMSCISCHYCGYPHLDLGDFARKPHRKHTCGHCGRDSTVSPTPVVSTPLQPLHDQFSKTVKYEAPDRELNLDDYSGCSYAVWASTPAIVWTASRPQELGVHVHVHRGSDRIVDDTFGTVMLNGKPLDRAELVQKMISRSLV
jgi:hypothetical protein